MSYHCWSTDLSHPNYFSSFYYSPEESLLFVGSLEKSDPLDEVERELDRLAEPVIIAIGDQPVTVDAPVADQEEGVIPCADPTLLCNSNEASSTCSSSPAVAYRMNVDRFRSLPVDDPSALLWLPLTHPIACSSTNTPYGLVAVSSAGGLLSLIDPFQLLHGSKYRERNARVFTRQTNQAIYSMAYPSYRPDSLLTLGIYEINLWDLRGSLDHPTACVKKSYTPPSCNSHCWVDDCLAFVCDNEVNFLDVRESCLFSHSVLGNRVSHDAKITLNSTDAHGFIVSSSDKINPFCEEWDMRCLGRPVKTFTTDDLATPYKLVKWKADRLLGVTNDDIVHLWDTATAKLIAKTEENFEAITDIAWTNSPHLFSTISNKKVINIWSTPENEADQSLSFVTSSESLNSHSEPMGHLAKRKVPPPHFDKIPFASLISEDEAIRKPAMDLLTLCMHKSSYAVITMTEEQIRVIREAEAIQAVFYNCEKELKQEIAIAKGRDVGYKYTDDVKEFFQMRKASGIAEFPWPRVAHYQERITALWDLLDQMSRFFIGSMCESIGLPRDVLDDLFDTVPQPSGSFSHSIMGLYRYFGHRIETTTCLVHRDMGLVSLIPRANLPGLEVLDCSNHKWIEVEKFATRDDIIMIGCQTLDRITNGYFPGNIHRVVGEKDVRTSIVYKMRAHSDGIIDPAKYQCEALAKFLVAGGEPQSVLDWMHEELDGKDSVNFPGKSKDNYHSMVFDPSQNLSIRQVFEGRVVHPQSSNKQSK